MCLDNSISTSKLSHFAKRDELQFPIRRDLLCPFHKRAGYVCLLGMLSRIDRHIIQK